MASKSGSKANSGRTASKKSDAKHAKSKSAKAKKVAAAYVPPVRGDEKPWTTAELTEIRHDLERDIARALADLKTAEEDLQGLIWDAGDGSGDDQADAGAKTYEREQELALADNAREVLRQNEHALERIADGTYGVCESCGKPVGKLRLQAFPRATLCMPCKTKQERR